MKLSKNAFEIEQYIDKYAFGSYLTLVVADEEFAPLLHIGMNVTIKLNHDMEQTEGLKLIRFGTMIYLSWFQRKSDAVYLHSSRELRGTYSAKQVEKYPIAVLGDVVDIN